ncbi:MAG: ATP-dependent DNA helicase [Deltaproteobacteria bacterium]|nr:ATP-dependent DNA helicase [Deltaproteobacteria bacterium]
MGNNQTPLKDIFGPSGLLSKTWPEYEFRKGQLDMAGMVAQALSDSRMAIIEAGTGTGKTLAYLVPAILSGMKVVVSTGTKNLQEQIFFKDIPFIRSLGLKEFRSVLMKGRQNYLCLNQLIKIAGQSSLGLSKEKSPLDRIWDWSKKTKTGDKSELTWLAENDPLWSKVASRADRCLGQKCSKVQDCFLNRLRGMAAKADLVVVNHHLFFADLAVRESGFGAVIPMYEAAIFDEAHELEDTAGQYFGVSVSTYRFSDLITDIRGALKPKNRLTPKISDLLDSLDRALKFFFDLFGQMEGRRPIPKKPPSANMVNQAVEIRDRLSDLGELMLDLAKGDPNFETLPDRTKSLKNDFWSLMNDDDDNYVYFSESRGKHTFLSSLPITVRDLLAKSLFSQEKPFILTSATLSTGGDFNYVKSRLGVTESTLELVVNSHFDYARQAILYVPARMPSPSHPDFIRSAAEEISRILHMSSGRAFVLFTSYRNMTQAYDLLASQLPYTMMMQGERPKTALIDAFRKDRHSVLFATSSFWQGVDVPGEALSCVIIDKLPFDPPGDPVVSARINMMNKEGRSPFIEYQVPVAVIALKQGLGRLIRGSKDRGLMAVLDTRLVSKDYGRVFIKSLPQAPLTRRPEHVVEFFRRIDGDSKNNVG